MSVIKKGRYWVELDEKGEEVKRSLVRFESKPKPKKKSKK